ncbi:MAG: helix-hairpin-helix domain-containing protein [Clostridiales Family XIII bacterium]|jgi:competence protein ComEA|nr:helix-hairpin-helix domain-containing protein [Clostridiales Family XIII bacterium]
MTINLTPKKIVLAVCVVAVLIAGGILYMKQVRDAETLAYVDRADVTDTMEQAGADGDGDGGGGAATESAGEEGADGAESVSPPAETSIYVDVAGAVKHPGVVTMSAGSRVFQAIEAAGGETDDADTRAINLAAVLNDGEHIYVPTKNEAASGNYPQGEIQGSAGGSGDNAKININTADSTALQQLNGVGPATAQKIIDYRNANGKFKTIEALKNVSGIGDKTFEKLKDAICV